MTDQPYGVSRSATEAFCSIRRCHVLRLGADATDGAALGPWLDEEGERWQPQPDGSCVRIEGDVS